MRKVLKNNLIITLGRQFGSGGRKIGQLLAQELNIPFYDRELIDLISEETGYSVKTVETFDENAKKPFYSFMLSGGVEKLQDLSINDKIFVAQANTIKSLAKEGSCIFVGRCADYILRNDFNIMTVFIYKDITKRCEYAIKEYDIPSDKALSHIKKIDKTRQEHYNYYTGNKWGIPENYDLYLNSKMGFDNVVKMILHYLEIYYGIEKD